MHQLTDLPARARAIELLLLDVDGVLTDGRIVYTDAGAELKRFHVRDGSGLKFWHAAGKRSAIVSGRNSAAVVRRATELGIGTVLQGRDDKPHYVTAEPRLSREGRRFATLDSSANRHKRNYG